MQNHYFRKPLRVQDRIVNTFESFIYSLLPEDRLVTAEDVCKLATASPHCPRDLTRGAIKTGLNSLEDDGKITLILGVTLEKLIDRGIK